MSVVMTLCRSLIFSFLVVHTLSHPSTICFIGDTVYGSVVDPWINTMDPRTLMGTFSAASFSETTSVLSVDYSAPIYQHKNFDVDTANYIFKVKDIGWVVSENAEPSKANIDDIELTCFHDDIADCTTYSWFEGYGSNEIPVYPMGITIGKCNS